MQVSAPEMICLRQNVRLNRLTRKFRVTVNVGECQFRIGDDAECSDLSRVGLPEMVPRILLRVEAVESLAEDQKITVAKFLETSASDSQQRIVQVLNRVADFSAGNDGIDELEAGEMELPSRD